MTFEELLIACGEQKKLPKVEVTALNHDHQKSKFKVGDVGQVVTVKDGDGYYGCGVFFGWISYVIWFYAETKDDNRKNYMEKLKIV